MNLLAEELGVSEEEPSRTVVTSIGEEVQIDLALLRHMVEKREDRRERFGKFILPTLTDPFEVFETEYTDGTRRRYIGVFSGDDDLMVVVKVEEDGSILWNIMQTDDKRINRQRVGKLIRAKG